jgi:hypothetical protein
MATAALAVGVVPDPTVIAEELVREIDLSSPAPSSVRNLKPALYASVGILITLGITFVGLRRRGLV